MDCVKRKSAFEHAQNAQIQIILYKVSAERLPFIISGISNVSVSRQPDQGLLCSNFPEDTFSHVAAQ